MKRLNKKTIVIALIVLAIVVIVAVVLGGKSGEKKKDEMPAKPALTVTTTQPSQARLPIRLSANGGIFAWQEAIIGSESNGLQLTDVRVNVGDVVKKGQVLATFSVAATQADVAQARANVMEAEANYADAKNNAERARTLQTTGALSTQQINQYLTTEQTAKAKAEAAKATLAVQAVRLAQTQVLASDNGVISARNATVGAVVSAGTELFRLIRQGRIEWRAEVTSEELGRIAPGALALVTGANGTQVKGKVRTIAPTVDPQNRSALVYVDLLPTPANVAPVRAGMFATGEFEMGTSNAIVVPQQSVVIRDGFTYIFRLGADNRVTQIKVKAGRRVGDRIEVTEGLTPDATLVVSGAGFLNDGDLVKVVPAGAAAETPSSAASTAAAPQPSTTQPAVKKAETVAPASAVSATN
jgi:RND family efflux transporter MFP subunit